MYFSSDLYFALRICYGFELKYMHRKQKCLKPIEKYFGNFLQLKKHIFIRKKFVSFQIQLKWFSKLNFWFAEFEIGDETHL